MTPDEAQANYDKARQRDDGTITGHHKALVKAVNEQLEREIAEHLERRAA